MHCYHSTNQINFHPPGSTTNTDSQDKKDGNEMQKNTSSSSNTAWMTHWISKTDSHNNNNNSNKMQENNTISSSYTAWVTHWACSRKKNPTVELPADQVEQSQWNHTNCRSSGSGFTDIYYNEFDTAGMNTNTSYSDDNNNNTNIDLWVS